MHPIFHNKKKLGLGLIITGTLLCVLPLLMSTSDSPFISQRLASEMIYYHSCWGEWHPREEICVGTLTDLRASVKSLVGFGLVLIGIGVFVRFSGKG